MSTGPQRSQPPLVFGDVDAHGRAVPLSGDEIQRRNLAIIRALDSLDAIGSADEQRETLDALVKALDEDRGVGRKLFGL